MGKCILDLFIFIIWRIPERAYPSSAFFPYIHILCPESRDGKKAKIRSAGETDAFPHILYTHPDLFEFEYSEMLLHQVHRGARPADGGGHRDAGVHLRHQREEEGVAYGMF